MVLNKHINEELPQFLLEKDLISTDKSGIFKIYIIEIGGG